VLNLIGFGRRGEKGEREGGGSLGFLGGVRWMDG
jgi:hypothetical protein